MVSVYTVDRLLIAKEQELICNLNQMGTSVIFHNIFLLNRLSALCKLHCFSVSQFKSLKRIHPFIKMAPSFFKKRSILSDKRMRPFRFVFGEKISPLKKNVSGYQRQPLPNATTRLNSHCLLNISLLLRIMKRNNL